MNDWVGLLIVVVIIFIVWWLLARFAKQSPEEFHIEHHNEVETHLEETATRTTSVSIPETPIIPDDLTILEGIGPKVNKVLQARGISTFNQLAETKVDYLKSILEENGLQFMDPETWPKQSRLAAEGKMDELKALMDSLKGGRKS
jgi:predicted flap endonuclease-1-like 5' DNA nuclease